MKFLILFSFLLTQIEASEFPCKRDSGITKVEGGYLYTEACHVAVGNLVETNKNKEQQITHLKKALELKDLALTKSEERAELWKSAALDLESKYAWNTRLDKYENWLFFGLGIAVTAIAVKGAGELQ